MLKIFRYIIAFILLGIPVGMSADGSDPVLAGMISNQTSKAKKMYATQDGVIGGIAGEHVVLQPYEKSLFKLHKEMNEYLDSLRHYLVYAAEGYGFYMQVDYLLQNMGELTDEIFKAPGNGVAVALCNRGDIYPKLLKKSVKIVNTIQKVCLKRKDGTTNSKMTTEERMRLLFTIRPQLEDFNRDLRQLRIYVKYTSMNDAWRLLMHKYHPYERDINGSATRALDDWNVNAHKVRVRE